MTSLDRTFTATERARAARWKATSPALPAEARVPARYVDKDGKECGRPLDFCLPATHRALSLLPEVRALALSLFAEEHIPWHPDGQGPSNHLLSSQVQCVNALGQMVVDPSRAVGAFAALLGTEEVLEIEPGRFLTFEYIGENDYFNEAPDGSRVRGSMCTSVDAAFLHRTSSGVRELVLIEWKYTESYTSRDESVKYDTRRARYIDALSHPDSPVDPSLLEFGDLLDEPIYQLMRQQLLAAALERDHTHDADVVRILHVHPNANLAYQQSLHRPSQLEVGATVNEVWNKLLRRPDRFTSVDNSLFLDPAITSAEYVSRYGDAPTES